MPRINLLPVKQARRRVSLRNEFLGSIGVVGITLVGLILWSGSLDSEEDVLRLKLVSVDQALLVLAKEVKKVEDLKGSEQKVQNKIKVIGGLQGRRQGPARMLEDLSAILTYEARRVWFSRLAFEGGGLRIEGHALDHEDISELQAALKRRSMFFSIRLEGVTSAEVKGVRVLTWKLTCKVKLVISG